jgi:hypothetical protein
MPELDSNEPGNVRRHRPAGWSGRLNPDADLLAEEILCGGQSTPIGQLLKKIASLPEVRQEKVLRIREQLNRGQYDLNEHLDFALDKVLEELIL